MESEDTAAVRAEDADQPAAANGTERTAPSDAFGVLGNEVRTAVLRQLADQPCSFSTLAAESEAETSAGFAYHLRQLDGQFVRQREDERYELTGPGREAVRAMEAGTVTVSVDRSPTELDEQCPRCGDHSLELQVRDSVAEIACDGCGTTLLELSLPPGSALGHDVEAVPDALDAYHRHRIRSYADGVCPDCGGHATGTVEQVSREDTDQPPGAGDSQPPEEAAPWPPGSVQLSLGCAVCSAGLDCPVALRVLDHPAVVSFYREHGKDVTDRPLWDVGPEWRERPVSTDPWCVLVSTRLDDEVLELYLSGDARVVGTQRREVSERPETEEVAAGSDAASDDAPA
jgi:transcription elongation factor Elf1